MRFSGGFGDGKSDAGALPSPSAPWVP